MGKPDRDEVAALAERTTMKYHVLGLKVGWLPRTEQTAAPISSRLLLRYLLISRRFGLARFWRILLSEPPTRAPSGVSIESETGMQDHYVYFINVAC